MSKREYTPEEKKALLLKKKKAEMIKKKKEEKENNESLHPEKEHLKLLTDKERIAIGKELKQNAIGSFAKFDFYKDGYKKTLGILAFLTLTTMVSLYALVYAMFIYSPQNAYIVSNGKNQILEPTSLKQALYSDVEIIDFATEAYRDINAYNYVSLKNSYFPNLLKHFTEGTLSKYKNQFNKTAETAYVMEHKFIVESVIFKGATIDKVKSEEWSSQSKSKVWEVVLNSVKLYQNEKSYVRKRFETRIRIIRTSSSQNERRIAVHSFVDREIKEK